MSKHTPGPWLARSDEISLTPDYDITGEDAKRLIACCYSASGTGHYACPAEAEANARLIAAAPDLLNQCKWAAGYLGAIVGQHGQEGLDAINEAIAKAEMY